MWEKESEYRKLGAAYTFLGGCSVVITYDLLFVIIWKPIHLFNPTLAFFLSIQIVLISFVLMLLGLVLVVRSNERIARNSGILCVFLAISNLVQMIYTLNIFYIHKIYHYDISSSWVLSIEFLGIWIFVSIAFLGIWLLIIRFKQLNRHKLVHSY